MQSNNKVLLAAAGSGKTEHLVNESLKYNTKKILIVTFTNKNKSEILKKYKHKRGYTPSKVEVKTWYSFLLSDCIRPYQKCVYPCNRVDGVFYRDRPPNRYIPKSDVKSYYLNRKNQIDKDRISDFAFQCFINSEGKVLTRLEEIYDYVFVDEVQDLSGYDLEILKLFFGSNLETLLVGDIRQATYSTSNTNKNKKYRGMKILAFFEEQEEKGICTIEGLNHSYRCNQRICNFADGLFPDLPLTESYNEDETLHDGIFCVNGKDIERYCEEYKPQILRYDARTKIPGALNFGESKGLTFDRVLIKPTKEMEQYLVNGEARLDDTTLAKFYVAVTRARYSVAFITDKNLPHMNSYQSETK